jgi:D-aspartate ligase
MDTSTLVVILGSGRHGGLTLARSLGRLGIPVYGVDEDPRAILFASRYCKRKFIWDSAGATRVSHLLHIGQEIGRAILIPTTDSAASFLASNAEALQSEFLFPFQAPNLVRSLCNKKEMFFLAKSIGIPTPNTVFPESRMEAVEYAKEARFPIIMKPIETIGRAVRSARKAIVASSQELIAHYDSMTGLDSPNVMLQEYIPGNEEANWMFNGYFDKHSRCLFGATGRKIRQHRPYAGVTTLGVCEPNPIVADMTNRFASAVGYRGILDIGYRYDARDDLYKVFDVNPRLGCTFRLFVSDTGMDVARALYFDLSGQSFSAGTVRPGRKWLVEDLDTFSSYYYWRSGALSFRKWFASFRGLEESVLCARDDLKPLCRFVHADLQLCLGKTEVLWRKRSSARTDEAHVTLP